MVESEVDTTSTTVRTYVPAYQRDQWDDHADELDMSRSEFVRSMVQAGRRAFGGEGEDEAVDGIADSGTDNNVEETRSPDVTPRGDGLETAVLEALREREYASWDELITILTEDLEGRLEETLQELQSADEVRHSGPNGGYTIDE